MKDKIYGGEFVVNDDKSENEKIHIKFDGGLADDNRVPFTEFVESLEGWRDFLSITSDTFMQGRLTTDRPIKDKRLRYEIGPVREGSVDVWLYELGAGGVKVIAGGVLWETTKMMNSALWEWRKRVYAEKIRSRRSDITIEQAAAQLARLAEDNGLEIGDEDDPVELTEKLDKSLKRALRPVVTSVRTVTLITNNTNIQIVGAEAEKVAMSKQYAEVTQPEEVSEPELRDIDIRSVDPDKKAAKFNFVDPQNDEEKGLKQGYVTDPRIARARDPYTGALHERSPVSLIVQKKILNAKSKAIRWELSMPDQEKQSVMFPID